MRILVTGGAGFIGHNFARLALERGHEVRVVDDLSTGYRDNLAGLDVDLREHSVLDAERLRDAMTGVDSVLHLGALGSVPRSVADPMASHQANATGTLQTLICARDAGVEHVMVSGSSSVYGLNPALPKDEREWVRPMSPYAVSKLASEQYVLAWQQSYGLQTLAFRFFNVYGPGQRADQAYAAVIPIFLRAMLRGEPVRIDGDGTQSRDFTYVGTVVRVLLDAAERRVSHPEPVNLAFGTNTTVLDLVGALEEILGTKAQVEHRERRAGDVPHSRAKNDSLRALFPDVEPVSLDEGLRNTAEWMKGLA